MLKIINCKTLKYFIYEISLFVSLNILNCRETRDVATVCRVQLPREAISGYVQTRDKVTPHLHTETSTAHLERDAPELR
jgi:hypothetical protein